MDKHHDKTGYRYPRTLQQAFGRHTSTKLETETKADTLRKLAAADAVALAVLSVAQIAIALIVIHALASHFGGCNG